MLPTSVISCLSLTSCAIQETITESPVHSKLSSQCRQSTVPAQKRIALLVASTVRNEILSKELVGLVVGSGRELAHRRGLTCRGKRKNAKSPASYRSHSIDGGTIVQRLQTYLLILLAEARVVDPSPFQGGFGRVPAVYIHGFGLVLATITPGEGHLLQLARLKDLAADAFQLLDVRLLQGV
jgi:hypothetical protein